MSTHNPFAARLAFLAMVAAPQCFLYLPHANAQVAGRYDFSQHSDSYTPIGSTGWSALFGTGWDNAAVSVPLPFNFQFGPESYDNVMVSTNGFIVFGNTLANNAGGGAYVNGSVQGLYLGGNATDNGIAGFNARLAERTFATTNATRTSGSPVLTVASTADLRVGMCITGTGIPANAAVVSISGNQVTMSANATSNGTSSITPRANAVAGTIGTAPNRTFVVQYTRVRRDGNNDDVNFQIRLHEGDGNVLAQTIEVVYGACSTTETNTSRQVQAGLRGTTSDFHARTSTSDWSATSEGGSNTNRVQFTSSITPPNGLLYRWTPNCTSPVATATVESDCAGGTFNILVNVTSLGNGASVDIKANGSTVHAGVGTGVHVLGPYPIGQSRTVAVAHASSTACDLGLGSFSSPLTCVANGGCLATPHPAIAANSCSAGAELKAGIAVTGEGDALGVNTQLTSVDLIIAHTSRNQLRVYLTAPNGAVREMIMNRGGPRSNFGNPGNCPTAVLTLDDGAAQSVADIPNNFASNNITGSWRPEQTLAGFSGDPNGTWVLTICSSGGNAGTLRHVALNFSPVDCQGVANGPAIPGSPCDDGDPNTTGDVYGANCTCSGAPVTLYSAASGAMGSTIWSLSPGGPIAPNIPNGNAHVVIRNGHAISVDGTRSAKSLLVETGGSLDIDAGTLSVGGHVTNHGVVLGGTGTLAVIANTPVTIGGSAPLPLFNLTVNTPQGTSVTTPITLLGTLQLNGGTFTANAAVKLASNALRTGRLGPVDPGASYVGNITMERYIPGGVTNWRMLGSPVQGATVNNWKDDFFTAGFPGSHYPNFYDPPGSGIHWPSIRHYVESNPGPSPSDGLVGVTNASMPLTPGKGFAAWSGDGLYNTSPFVIDVTGPPTIAYAPFTLPMSWTDTGNPSADGWNLVSNPLPSAISYGAIVRGANVVNAFHVFDPVSGNMATWNGFVGSNGANGTIQSSQGFWLKANGPAVNTTVSESAKTGSQSGGIFGGLEGPPPPSLRLRIASGLNNFSDETVVVFAHGSPVFNEEEGDALKFPFSHPQAPRIATRVADGPDLALNHHGAPDGTIHIPVMLHAPVTGTYTITATGIESLNGLTCLVLEDLLTGVRVPLHDGATITIEIAADADPALPRLLLHQSAMLVHEVQHVSCHGSGDASITLHNPGAVPVDITWTDAEGDILAVIEGMLGSAALQGLGAGHYTAHIGGTECPAQSAQFTIEEPWAMELLYTITPATCAESTDGHVLLEVLGGVWPYEMLWSTGATTPDLEGVGEGFYGVEVTDANGCVITANGLHVTAPEPIAGALVAPTTVQVMEPVQFSSTADAAEERFWDFGDGQTSTHATPLHGYAQPGEYQVTLVLQDEECSRTLGTTVSVGLLTTLQDLANDGPRAWSAGDLITIEGAMPQDLHLHVYDATGRTVYTGRIPANTPRHEIPTHTWTPGLYFLNASTAWEQWTYSLPVVR
ncbi:MAG: PKD domain-containing protein [Flavobacteriales bacterium]|nr:PKD domain-containing protein [Flavobacteriales bacterium]